MSIVPLAGARGTQSMHLWSKATLVVGESSILIPLKRFVGFSSYEHTALKRGVNETVLTLFRWWLELWFTTANLSIGSVRMDVVSKPAIGI